MITHFKNVTLKLKPELKNYKLLKTGEKIPEGSLQFNTLYVDHPLVPSKVSVGTVYTNEDLEQGLVVFIRA